MRRTLSIGHPAALVAMLITAISPSAVCADSLAASAGNQLGKLGPAAAPHVVDVELQPDGRLIGEMRDSAGAPVIGAPLSVTGRAGVMKTTSDANGRFALQGLDGGLYKVEAVGHTQACRAWKNGTAPPQAGSGLLVVQPGDVVLGQHCGSPVCGSGVCRRRPLMNPIVFGGIVAAAVAIPVAIHNSNDDDPATP